MNLSVKDFLLIFAGLLAIIAGCVAMSLYMLKSIISTFKDIKKKISK